MQNRLIMLSLAPCIHQYINVTYIPGKKVVLNSVDYLASLNEGGNLHILPGHTVWRITP